MTTDLFPLVRQNRRVREKRHQQSNFDQFRVASPPWIVISQFADTATSAGDAVRDDCTPG